MGVPLNMAILPVFAFGSFMGSVQLEQWLQLGAVKPVGLVAEYGPLNAFLLTLAGLAVFAAAAMVWSGKRSEEHTSELQSLMRISYAVFCLKKTKITTHTIYI